MSASGTTCTPCLNLLHQKWKEWLHAFTSNDPNSVQNQIDQLVYDFVLFLMLEYAPWLVLTDQGQQVRFSSALVSHLMQTVRDSLMQRVRKIAEPRNKDANRDVYSLNALLTDMAEHAHLLTRENLFQLRGVPYINDPDFTCRISFSQYSSSEGLHRGIDRMTGTTSANRSPRDTIPVDWFDQRRKRLVRRSERIREFSNKYISHAATQYSRSQVASDKLKVHRALLYTTIGTACRIFGEIRQRLLDGVNYGSLARLDVCPRYSSNDEVGTTYDLEQGQQFFNKLFNRIERLQRTLPGTVTGSGEHRDPLMECLRQS